jgi:hypothetical protein
MPDPEPPEIEELERVAAWRLRRVDADPADSASAAAADRLERLAADLRGHPYQELWTELRSLCNWLSESDAISDYADLAEGYRAGIGITERPEDGADYLRALLEIARSLL